MDWPAPCLSRDQWSDTLEHERHSLCFEEEYRFVFPRLFPAIRTPGPRRLNPNRPPASSHVPKHQASTCISVTQPCQGFLRLAGGVASLTCHSNQFSWATLRRRREFHPTVHATRLRNTPFTL
ncbi:hypothetical protein CGRA01v4_02721 [Colletotrichum graminicola]|nr:hypothetical protein CGRA01v4_02721 [Colletotrichum graminicola]